MTKRSAKHSVIGQENHFEVAHNERGSFQRDPQRIARDAALDGIYVLRTSLKSERLDAAQLWQEDRGKPILAVINQLHDCVPVPLAAGVTDRSGWDTH